MICVITEDTPQPDWSPQRAVKKRCLIYAHWDINGFVDPFVIHALRQYRPAVDRIVFVTTNYRLRSRQLEAVADDILVRENIGFDFMSWREGLQTLTPHAFDEVIFTNSSVYGPVWPMERVFQSPTSENGGLWGMSISRHHTLHLQSYFMAMSQWLLTSQLGQALWEDVIPFTDKGMVIEAYELAWMERCLAAGVPVDAIFDARRIEGIPVSEHVANLVRWPPRLALARLYRRAVRRGPSNPTHLHWKAMLESGVPFVKVDLFSRNPYGMRISRVYDWLQRHTDYPVEMIRRHQARLQRQRPAA